MFQAELFLMNEEQKTKAAWPGTENGCCYFAGLMNSLHSQLFVAATHGASTSRPDMKSRWVRLPLDTFRGGALLRKGR